MYLISYNDKGKENSHKLSMESNTKGPDLPHEIGIASSHHLVISYLQYPIILHHEIRQRSLIINNGYM